MLLPEQRQVLKEHLTTDVVQRVPHNPLRLPLTNNGKSFNPNNVELRPH